VTGGCSFRCAQTSRTTSISAATTTNPNKN
jgi:hypothetical protein